MAMTGFRHWCIICEGKSEVTYLALLSRFIRDRLAADSGIPPLAFSGKPPVHGAGGGAYPLVGKAYRDERKVNRRANFKIWVDADLYLREKAEAPTTFAQRELVGKGLFSFSALVFEDFLAMHFDDDLYAAWKRVLPPRGTSPIRWSKRNTNLFSFRSGSVPSAAPPPIMTKATCPTTG